MAIYRNDLNLQQGETFQLILNVQNTTSSTVNLSNYSASMQIRSSYTSNTVIEQLSTANGEISVANLGYYALSLPASRTAAVNTSAALGYPPKVTYVYDLTLTTDNGISYKIMYGQVNFYSQVTR